MAVTSESPHYSQLSGEVGQSNILGIDFVPYTTKDLQMILDVDGEYRQLLMAYSGILQSEPSRDSKQRRRQASNIKSYMGRILQDLLLVPEIEKVHSASKRQTMLYTLSSVAEGVGELLGIPIYANNLGIQTANDFSRVCAAELTSQRTISRIYTSLLSSNPKAFLHDWEAFQKVVAEQPQKFETNDSSCQFVFIVPLGLKNIHEQFVKEHFGEMPSNLVFQEGPASLSQIEELAENFVHKLGFQQKKDNTTLVQPKSVQIVEAQVTLEPEVTEEQIVENPQPLRRMSEDILNDFLNHAQTLLKQLVQQQLQRPTWEFMRKRLDILSGREVLQNYLSTDSFQEFYALAVSEFAKPHEGLTGIDFQKDFKGALFMRIAEDILQLTHGILGDIVLDSDSTITVYHQIFYPDQKVVEFPFGIRTMQRGIGTVDGFGIDMTTGKIVYGVEMSISRTKDFIRSYTQMKMNSNGLKKHLFESGCPLLAVVPKNHAFSADEQTYIDQGKIKVVEMPFTRDEFIQFADMLFKQYRKKDIGKSLREIEYSSRV